MKILYAIQGTGNGHLTVALEVLPYLMKKATVDILLSGTEVDVPLPYEIKFRFQGLCFVFGKKGGIDYLETYKKAKLRTLFAEIKSLPVEEYDLVVSDFEPVSAWACYLKNKPCIGFSHQAAVINKASPQPKNADLVGRAVLKYYAPVSVKYGFHFVPYNKNVFTPIIRKEIRSAAITNSKHYTVYLPSYSEKRIHRLLSRFPEKQWEVFSKRRTEPAVKDNITFRPVTAKAFVQSLASCSGVLCGAGFQTPSEALFLQKKLLVIPMKGQYEQQCNAAALKLMGIPVLKNLKQKQFKKLKGWLESESEASVHYPDETEWILSEIISRHQGQSVPRQLPEKPVSSFSRFRTLILTKIFYQSST